MKTIFKALPLIAFSLTLSQNALADDRDIVREARNNCLIGAAVGAVAVAGITYAYNKDAFFHDPMRAKDVVRMGVMIVPGSCVAGAMVGAVVNGPVDAPSEEALNESSAQEE